MSEVLCPKCGSRNPAHTEFCNYCNAYLGWIEKAGQPAPVPTRTRPKDPGWGDGWGLAPLDDRTRAVPVQRRGTTQAAGRSEANTGLRVEVEQSEAVAVTPGADTRTVPVQIANTSTVVEAYQVMALDAPPWLIVTPGQARLLPGTDERVQVGLAIAATDLVPVHRFQLTLRVQGESSPRLHRDVRLDLAVGPVEAPVGIRLEPSSVRMKDSTTAQLRVVLDNRRSNVGQHFELSGSDPEQQVRLAFQPGRVAVPPGGEAVAQVRVDAPLPPPGDQVNRTLTVTAVSDGEELTANVAVAQSASVVVPDPPIGLRLDPSVIHADRRSGVSHIVLDNRRGTRPQRIHLEADDVENVVRFTIVPQDVEVPAGQYAMARLTMQVPRVAAGESVTRTVNVSAWNGQDSVEARGQLVQETPPGTPIARVLLTLLGSLGMVLGPSLLWTRGPTATGVDWNYPDMPRFFGLDTSAIDAVLRQLGILGLVPLFVSVGSIVVFLGIIAALGILGTSGRVIRGAAVWGVIVLLLFLAAMVAALVVRDSFPTPQLGWLVTLVGCVLAFIGSFFPRPWGPSRS